MTEITAAMRAFVDEARSVPIEQEVARRGWKLRRAGAELVGPCPACGGDDRFGINARKGVFHCRGSAAGGDVIKLVQYVDACDFLSACAILTGRQPPKGEAAGPDEVELARREAERRAQVARREAEANLYRERERARMWDLWQNAAPARPGTATHDYLARRGLSGFVGASIRHIERLGFFHGAGGAAKNAIHYGPAMIAAIVGPNGHFAGAHLTWIDPSTLMKMPLIDPATGEALPSKKIRGSKKGGHIPLSRGGVLPRRLVIGEGIETVLSVRQAEHDSGRDISETLYWSAADLGNLGGPATETVAHPFEFTTDKRGWRRDRRVAGPVPDLDPDHPVLMPPERAEEIILLGDGDSDRFATEMTLKRAAARWSRPGRVIRIAWAPEGRDFNDVLRGAI
jgi:hypothetical protein